MTISIDKQSPLGIREQIKRLLRMLIETEELKRGEVIPSVRDLAMMLDVNRNTVFHAYRELGAQGWLKLVPGSGTYVGRSPGKKMTAGLGVLFDEVLAKAGEMGFSLEQVQDFFLTKFSLSCKSRTRRILVVECTPQSIAQLSAAIKKQLNVELDGVLIQKLEQYPEQTRFYLRGKDLVACGIDHINAFQKAVPDNNVDLVAVPSRPPIRILNELLTLPPGTSVGFSCVNQRSAEELGKNLYVSEGTPLQPVYVGLNRAEIHPEIFDACDIIFATSYVYDRVRKIVNSEKRVVNVDLSVDPGCIDLIRTRLDALKKSSYSRNV